MEGETQRHQSRHQSTTALLRLNRFSDGNGGNIVAWGGPTGTQCVLLATVWVTDKRDPPTLLE